MAKKLSAIHPDLPPSNNRTLGEAQSPHPPFLSGSAFLNDSKADQTSSPPIFNVSDPLPPITSKDIDLPSIIDEEMGREPSLLDPSPDHGSSVDDEIIEDKEIHWEDEGSEEYSLDAASLRESSHDRSSDESEIGSEDSGTTVSSPEILIVSTNQWRPKQTNDL